MSNRRRTPPFSSAGSHRTGPSPVAALPRVVLVKVKDGLFLGNREASLQAPFVFANKVAVIINCAGNQVLNRFEMNGIRYMTFYWKDTDTTIVLDSKDKAIEEIVQAINEAHAMGQSALIASFRGQSRGCCIGIAYLMKKYSWTTETAYEFMLSRQPDMIIKQPLLRQLKAMEDRLRKSGAQLLTFDHPFDQSVEDPDGFIVRMTYVNCRLLEEPVAANRRIPHEKQNRRHIAWADTAGKSLLLPCESSFDSSDSDDSFTSRTERDSNAKKKPEPPAVVKPILRKTANLPNPISSLTFNPKRISLPLEKPDSPLPRPETKRSPTPTQAPGNTEAPLDNLFIRPKASTTRASPKGAGASDDDRSGRIQEEPFDDEAGDAVNGTERESARKITNPVSIGGGGTSVGNSRRLFDEKKTSTNADSPSNSNSSTLYPQAQGSNGVQSSSGNMQSSSSSSLSSILSNSISSYSNPARPDANRSILSNGGHPLNSSINANTNANANANATNTTTNTTPVPGQQHSPYPGGYILHISSQDSSNRPRISSAPPTHPQAPTNTNTNTQTNSASLANGPNSVPSSPPPSNPLPQQAPSNQNTNTNTNTNTNMGSSLQQGQQSTSMPSVPSNRRSFLSPQNNAFSIRAVGLSTANPSPISSNLTASFSSANQGTSPGFYNSSSNTPLSGASAQSAGQGQASGLPPPKRPQSADKKGVRRPTPNGSVHAQSQSSNARPWTTGSMTLPRSGGYSHSTISIPNPTFNQGSAGGNGSRYASAVSNSYGGYK